MPHLLLPPKACGPKLAGFCLLFILPLSVANAGGKPQSQPQPPAIVNQADTAQTPSRGEAVFRAFAGAYPDRAGDAEYRDGDWTITVYGERFYFAEGRLLPASLRDKMNEYSAHPFYDYTEELPPWKPATEEETVRMKEQEERRKTTPAKRSAHFYDALWRTRNSGESWEHVKQIRFLGHTVQIHYSILTELSLVEEKILRESKTNPAVTAWINNLSKIESWNWRNIASSQSRSFHAYGAAIDLLPKSIVGLETYWLWTAAKIPEWWNVPYTRRFHPPNEVIKAFESFGFVWGGKWRYYDTMHFEYRPEILVLNGIARMNLRDLR